MLYRIQHTTTFRYTAPVTEHVTELRLQPRTEDRQHCVHFRIATIPVARLFSYRDHLLNTVHYFDVPRQHRQLVISSESIVRVQPLGELPPALPMDAWERLDATVPHAGLSDDLLHGVYTEPTDALLALRAELSLQREHADPLTLIHRINTGVHRAFSYVPHSTRVDSPIDEALSRRHGVCQDFAHIALALCRSLGIPARYVSGYLYHRLSDHDRSDPDATHAWLEVWLPEIGWLGFDPTNNLLAGERHIRVAVGRDYADVPPTRGVYRGTAEQQLDVEVQVQEIDEQALTQLAQHLPWSMPEIIQAAAAQEEREIQAAQQQQ